MSKTLSIKNADGATMLSMVCSILHKEDPDFINFKNEFQESYDSVKCVVDDLKKGAAKA